MTNTPQRRLHVLGGIILVPLLVLVGRLWVLQLTRWEHFARAAAGNRTSVVYSPAPRGMILDTNGVVLAENRPVWDVSISPSAFPHDPTQAGKIIVRLASILRQPSDKIAEAIKKARAQHQLEVVPLQGVGENVPLPIVAQIEEQALTLPGVSITEMAVRSYPHHKLAAHVLGYTGAITAAQYAAVRDLNYPDLQSTNKPTDPTDWVVKDPIYAIDSTFGQTGLEREYEIDLNLAPPLPVLRGRRGRTIYEVDAAQKRVRLIEQRPPAVGASIYLTIDANVQQVAENALQKAISGGPNRNGAAVAVDVRTGAVLAMASLPSYDPNDIAKKYATYANAPNAPLVNKAITGCNAPGSTFKMISATAALDGLGVSPSKTFTCHGFIMEGRTRYRCWKHSGHGTLDMRHAIAESCDVYFYELVRQCGLTVDLLAKYAHMFGLGEDTGIDLPSEYGGLVPTAARKRILEGERWWTGDTLNTVIGQGYNQATPLQMAMACAVVANNGYLLRPHLVRKIVWPAYMKLSPTIIQPVVRRHLNLHPGVLQVVREGMRLAVTSDNGTAHIMRGLPVTVAAKTGSAEVYGKKNANAWFVCFAPYEAPRYAIAVFVAQGGHGGSVAGPVARSILAALYGVKKPTLMPAPGLSD